MTSPKAARGAARSTKLDPSPNTPLKKAPKTMDRQRHDPVKNSRLDDATVADESSNNNAASSPSKPASRRPGTSSSLSSAQSEDDEDADDAEEDADGSALSDTSSPATPHLNRARKTSKSLPSQPNKVRKGQTPQSIKFGKKEHGNIQDVFGFDPDEILDSEADSDADSELSDSPDDDIDVADDDDDYDAVDRLSDTSDGSANFEKEFENDILAAGEGGIDWNDETTYAYDDSWQANQYSYAIELDSPMPIAENTILSLAFDQERRESLDDAMPETPTGSAYLGRLLFDDDSSEDGASNSSQSSNSAASEGGSRRNSAVSADGSQDDVKSVSTEADDDTDEDEAPETRNSSAASSTIPKPASSQSTPSPIVVKKERFPLSADKDKRSALRKLVLDPRKAICISTRTPNGRVLQFTVPKNNALKVITVRGTRRENSARRASKFDLRAILDHGVDTRTGSIITDVINGRLFQQYHCSPQSSSRADNVVETEFARNPFLTGTFRPMYPSRSSGNQGGLLDDLGNFIFDDEIDDDDILSLIDFEAGENDETDSQAEAGFTPLSGELELDDDLLATPSKIPLSTETTSQSYDDDDEDDGEEDEEESEEVEEIAHEHGTGTKRRAGSISHGYSTGPVLKKKRGEIAV